MNMKISSWIFVGIMVIPGLVSATPGSQSNQSPNSTIVFSLDQVLDHPVQNTDGVKLGKISSLMFTANGRISHAVLSHGGFMGINANKVLIPWDKLMIKDPATGEVTKESFVTEISESQLSNADKLSSLDLQKLNISTLSSEFQTYRIFRANNSNGNLTLAENKNHMSQPSDVRSNDIEMKFESLDKNGNGVLEKTELSAMNKSSVDFDTIDNDKNGKISKSEYSRYNTANN